MKSCKQRLETFAHWPKPQIDPKRLANAGFYYLQEGDKVRCAWCRGVIGEWEPSDVPFDEHAKFFKTCPFILNPPAYALEGEDECGHRDMCSSSRNVAPGTYPEGAILHSAPKQPHMVSPGARLSTFTKNTWPASSKVRAEDLVEAGFFFLGIRDFTKCFHCEGGLCNWEEGDDPWVEHARWFPECRLVQLSKGEAFVAECRKMHHQIMNEADVRSLRSAGSKKLLKNLRNELEVCLSSPTVEFYLKEGISANVVRRTLENIMVEKGRGFESLQEMVRILSQKLKVSKAPSTQEAKREDSERKEIPERMLCVVCMAQERSILFLPCRHLVTCPSCAASVSECVSCREAIGSSVRTFYS
ncbi:baculoviral IAP repeat-containing protein 7 [Galendromus occidentalis]|uniref:Baculoviral IAP repeat-containing protein 7 n=1 Tax=Galendromus occidentalis TaxID=34638 RepID=A0AAJ6W0B9_9ACAR|nr:baculoviral IAP repeat-containing protein 7 [Galendromus occidentalis]